MVRLASSTQEAIRAELRGLAKRERGEMVRQFAALYRVSVRTIRRVAPYGREQKGGGRREDYREWVRTAVTIAHRAPAEPVALDIAIEAGISNGELPPAAAHMPLSSAYRIRRELGLHRTGKRTQRLWADYPMQAVQFDGSTSMYLSVKRQLDDGDWLLKLYRRPISARGYKNKPLGPDRERPITYGLWDMATGYRLSSYVVARGENALDSAEALVWMLAEKEDKRLVMHGVPDDLWLDQGPITKSRVTTDLLERLDIHLVTGEAYNKTRMGGVERGWRTLWARFERSLFLLGRDELTLAEVNARLTEYLVRENDRGKARTLVGERRVSREAAWTALTNARPEDNRLRRLPDNPLATLAAESQRRLNRNGHLHWDGLVYEAPTLYDVWVTARRAPNGSGAVVIEHVETGWREEATLIKQRAYGDVRAAPKLPLEKLLEDAPAESPGADVYAPAPDAPNVVRMAARTSEPAALENPLAVGTYNNIEEAMRAFYGLYEHRTTLDQDRIIRRFISEQGLTKKAVINLAHDMLSLSAPTT